MSVRSKKITVPKAQAAPNNDGGAKEVNIRGLGFSSRSSMIAWVISAWVGGVNGAGGADDDDGEVEEDRVLKVEGGVEESITDRSVFEKGLCPGLLLLLEGAAVFGVLAFTFTGDGCAGFLEGDDDAGDVFDKYALEGDAFEEPLLMLRPWRSRSERSRRGCDDEALAGDGEDVAGADDGREEQEWLAGWR